MPHTQQQLDYLGAKCAFCGATVLDAVERYGTNKRQFEFDHIDRKKKSKNYNNLIRQKMSSVQLDELDKCVLLCVKCHKIRTAQNINMQCSITSFLGDREQKQSFKGGAIIDRKDKQFAFFTDESFLLTPYTVQIDNEIGVVYFQYEVANLLFQKWLHETILGKKLSIYDCSGSLILQAYMIDDNSYTIKFDIHCTFFQAELDEKPGVRSIWVRNGIVVTKDGQIIRDGWIEIEASYSQLPNDSRKAGEITS